MAKFNHVPGQGVIGGGGKLIRNLQSSNIGWAADAMPFWWGFKLKVDGTGFWDKGGDVALAAAGSQVINLNTTFEATPFPEDVFVEAVFCRVITAFAGAATPTLSVGDAGNDDEWVDLLDLTTTGVFEDSGDADATAAVAGVPLYESAYVPLATIAAAANIDTLTAGEVDIMFRFRPTPPILRGKQL